MVRTGEAGPSGISCIVVEKGTPGLSFGAREKKLGWKSQPTAMVMFENCRVPVGKPHRHAKAKASSIAMAGLDGGRLNIAACSLGGAQFCLDRTIEYMKRAQAIRLAACRFPGAAIPHRRLCDRARGRAAAGASRRGRGRRRRAGGDAARRDGEALATDAGFEVVNGCLQLHGGYGYLRDHPIERVLRDVRVHQILEGTNEIMRLIVSRDLLDN